MALDIPKLFNEELPAALAAHQEEAKAIGAKYQLNITGAALLARRRLGDGRVVRGRREGRRLARSTITGGLPEAPRESPGQRHAALLRGQAQGRGQPDARDEAPEALLVSEVAMQPLAGVRVLESDAAPSRALRVARARRSRRHRRQGRGPGGGDYLRLMPPQVRRPVAARSTRSTAASGAWCSISSSRAGQGRFLRLVPRYDVLLEQFRPGVLDRLGARVTTCCSTEPAARRVRAHRLRADGPARPARGPRHQLPRARRRARPPGPRRAARPRCPASSSPTSRRPVVRDRHPGRADERERTGQGRGGRRRHERRRVRPSRRRRSACHRSAALPTARRRDAHRRDRAVQHVRRRRTARRHARRARAEVLDGVLRGRRHRRSTDERSSRARTRPSSSRSSRTIFRTKSRRERGARSRPSTTAASSRCSRAATSSAADPHLAARGMFFEIAADRGHEPAVRTPLTPRDRRLRAAAAAPASTPTRSLREAGAFERDEIAALRARGDRSAGRAGPPRALRSS